MSDILKKICDVKDQEVAAAKKAVPFAEMRRDAESRVSTRDFVGARYVREFVQLFEEVRSIKCPAA